ncbi:MAG: hypothetical protein ACYTKD_20880 [Planctomycetota bacterium]|jgi:hypothetical protein
MSTVRVVLPLLGLVLGASARAGEQDGEHSAVIGPDGELAICPITFSNARAYGIGPGQRCIVEVWVGNADKVPVHIPLSSVPTSLGSAFQVTAHLSGGGRELTLPAPLPQRPGNGTLLSVLPGKGALISSWFIPWTEGEYTWSMTIRNVLRSRHERIGAWAGEVKIPYVWVGEARFSGSVTIRGQEPMGRADAMKSRPGAIGAYALLGKRVSFDLTEIDLAEAIERLRGLAEYPIVFAPGVDLKKSAPVTLKVADIPAREALSWLLKVGWPGEPLAYEYKNGAVVVDLEDNLYVDGIARDIRTPLEDAEAMVLSERRPLGERLGALARLVRMRHIFATDTLVRIENETREDPLIHPHVVRALNEMAFRGTGYRELALFDYIARNRRSTPMERILCLDVLAAYAGRAGAIWPRGGGGVWPHRDVVNGGVSPHLVTTAERELAARLLKRLWADLGMRPGRIDKLLEPRAADEARLPGRSPASIAEADVAPVTPSGGVGHPSHID